MLGIRNFGVLSRKYVTDDLCLDEGQIRMNFKTGEFASYPITISILFCSLPHLIAVYKED